MITNKIVTFFYNNITFLKKVAGFREERLYLGNKKEAASSRCDMEAVSAKTAATYSPTLWAVPSARPGLTSLFGMGRGGTPEL